MWRWMFMIGIFGAPAIAQDVAPFAAYHSASKAELSDPHDLAFGPDGNLYVADKFANRVAILDPRSLEIIGSIGEGELAGAHDVSFAPDGRLYVSATGISAVVVYDLSGETPVRDAVLGPFSRTEGVLAHSNGQLYVMASGSGELAAVQDNAKVVGVATGLFGAHDVAEAPDGTIWVADNNQRRLVQYTPELDKIRVMDDAKYGFVGPRYLDFDPSGMLVVADQDAHRVLKINPITGAILGIIGSGSPGLGPNLLDDPEGVAIRGSEYYFADSDNNRIVKYIVALN